MLNSGLKSGYARLPGQMRSCEIFTSGLHQMDKVNLHPVNEILRLDVKFDAPFYTLYVK